ncbi:hypothetical protein [Gluconobacter sp. P5B12]|uniref:hypothetical protein n=1 Tax=unclassified Gluconobacter TaxID=2644261 RepID=UPI001C041C8B|nr:hypothetical protein [Gluconobacter sp. P5B12]
MKFTIIDQFKEGNATCILCRTSLSEYVQSLPDDFRDYYVQRGIVANRFLDNLWDTLENNKHIPSIVLVCEGQSPEASINDEIDQIISFKILDGLQRSHRLKEAWDAANFYISIKDDSDISPVRIARQCGKDLKEKGINSALFQKVIKTERNGVRATKLFENNNIWLELWFGLTDSQQIQKMLILNAGHKSVNIKHQVELLFIGYLSILQKELGDTKIIRENKQSSISYSKDREAGGFHFSHLISAFISLNSGKPIMTNADFSAERSFDDVIDSDNLLDTDSEILISFSRVLKHLDAALTDKEGIKWLGREVVLVGIFGAIGAYAYEKNCSLKNALENFDNNIKDYVQILNLSDFEFSRNSLDLSKVNLGSVNRIAVFRATLDFLKKNNTNAIKWNSYFRTLS